MTTTNGSLEGHSDLERLVHAAEHLDRFTLQKLLGRLQAMEHDDSVELDRITGQAAHLTRWERHLFSLCLRELEPLADVDDELDTAEILANKNFLG